MRRGRFADAWAIRDRSLPCIAEDEWQRPRHLQRVWRGQSLDRQRVLVRCYHGLGDTVQFVRYLPMLRRVAAEVVLWVQPSLIPLVASMPGVDRLLPLHDGDPGIPFDVDVEIMELAHVFRTTLDTLPSDVPYLTAPPPALPGGLEPRIAMAWRAGEWAPQRSLPAEVAAGIVAGLPGRVDVLQHTLLPGERRHFAAPPPRSLTETARLLHASDLVITVDTVFAHLAGALGRPVWLLLPTDADWRWMQGRNDSPWYPTARLFRQRRAGDWSEVAARVRERLFRWLDSRVDRRRRQARSWGDGAPPESPAV
jgi:hypothetical protein